MDKTQTHQTLVGPNGFTNTIEKMQAKAGGEWIFIMHGPDEKNYPKRAIFRNVVEHKQLFHEHFDPNFIARIEFESHGNKTLLTWYKLYETPALFEMVEKHHKSNEGFKHTLEKLTTYLDDVKSKLQ